MTTTGVEQLDAPAERAATRRALLRLCAVAFLLNCQPSEPYLTEYMHEVKGLSTFQINDRVYPWSTWSSFAALLPAAALAEEPAVGYRGVVLGGVALREATRALLVFGRGVGAMAAVQCTYGIATAVNAVFFAYAYCVVPRRHYAAATGALHAAYALGNVGGSALGGFLVRVEWCGGATGGATGGGTGDDDAAGSQRSAPSLTGLFYLSWAFVCAGLLVACALPPPARRPPASLVRLCREHGVDECCDECCARWLCREHGVRRTLARELGWLAPAWTMRGGGGGGGGAGGVDTGGGGSDGRDGGRDDGRHEYGFWARWWALAYAANSIAENFYSSVWYDLRPATQSYGWAEAAVEAGKAVGYMAPAAVAPLFAWVAGGRGRRAYGGGGVRGSASAWELLTRGGGAAAGRKVEVDASLGAGEVPRAAAGGAGEVVAEQEAAWLTAGAGRGAILLTAASSALLLLSAQGPLLLSQLLYVCYDALYSAVRAVAATVLAARCAGEGGGGRFATLFCAMTFVGLAFAAAAQAVLAALGSSAEATMRVAGWVVAASVLVLLPLPCGARRPSAGGAGAADADAPLRAPLLRPRDLRAAHEDHARGEQMAA